MGAALAEHLRGRVVFVVGKGGVGKTTTACATALHFADQGELTHLISTDPAHSVADVLAQEIRSVTTSQCSAQLRVEQLDAKAYADAWLGRARAPLLHVVERGTYLDGADADSFMNLSLPGVDEVMSALRLVELHEQQELEHIVVDTAPTGHTLRLLDADRIIESWADALSAMIAKADAVALALFGRSTSSTAVDLLADWRSRCERFKQMIGDAEFIVVTRQGTVVAAETKRLVEALQERALHVAAVIGGAGPTPEAEWYAPEFAERPRGCDALRSWWQTLRTADVALRADAQSAASTLEPETPRPRPECDAIDWLQALQQRMLLVAGKGGVGKSTVAAALALLRAKSAEACLVSTDPAGSLADVLEHSVTAEPTETEPSLRVWQLDARRAYQRLRGEYDEEVRAVFERLGLDQNLQLDRQVIERLWSLAPPGIDEIVALAAMLDAVESCATLVLDSAPTGHFLRLIEMPGIAVDWSHALMRLLLKYHVAGSLEAFTRDVLSFARRTRELQEKFIDPEHTAAILVSLEQPVVWVETVRLHAALEQAKISVAALIINRDDPGHDRGHPELANTRIIRAPRMDVPPTGPAALRRFLARWELVPCAS
jgi:arsenite-transporting ATPase